MRPRQMSQRRRASLVLRTPALPGAGCPRGRPPTALRRQPAGYRHPGAGRSGRPMKPRSDSVKGSHSPWPVQRTEPRTCPSARTARATAPILGRPHKVAHPVARGGEGDGGQGRRRKDGQRWEGEVKGGEGRTASAGKGRSRAAGMVLRWRVKEGFEEGVGAVRSGMKPRLLAWTTPLVGWLESPERPRCTW